MGKPWFAAKTYGVGVSPSSAAGWAAMIVFVLLLAALLCLLPLIHAALWVTGAAVALLLGGFVVLALLKSDGRPLRWRWGAD